MSKSHPTHKWATRRKPVKPTQQSRTTSGGEKKRKAPSQTKLLLVLIIAVVGAVLAAHWPGLSAKAVSFDDAQYLTENYLVQNPGWASAKRFLTEVFEPSTVQGYYQPLTMISLMLDYAVGGRSDDLMPFHRTSLLLHVINTTLLILLIYFLFDQPIVAAILGLLFGLHPMTVEPICWVGERKTLLAAFFALCCLISYVRYTRNRSWKSYVVTVALYILALMAKPTSTPLPVLFLLLDYWPLRRLSKKSVLEKLPLFAIAGVFALVTIISQGRTATVTMPGQYAPARVVFILCHNIIFYLYKIIWPGNLSSHYPFPKPLALSHPMVLVGVLGAFVLIPALLISLRRTRALFTGWLFFFVAILPTMGIIGFTNVIASDKFAYLPAIGLLLPLAYFLTRFWSTANLVRFGKYRIATLSVVVILAGSELIATRKYIIHWKNTETLLRYMLSLAPNAPSLHNGLGLFLFEQGRIDKAVPQYYKALKLNANDSETHNNLGVALAAQGKTSDAIVHYIKAGQLRPNYFIIHNNLGNALAQQGKFDEAVVEYRKALSIKPLYPSAHYNLANALENQGRLDEAEKEYQAAIHINPRYTEAYNNLGNVLSAQGKTEQAIRAYREALRINPVFASAHYNLAMALTEQRRADEAIKEYHEAIRLKPDYFDAYNNLAVLLAQQGRPEEAVTHFTQALKIRPLDADIHNNLGIALASMGKMDQAITHFQDALRIDLNNAGTHYNLAVSFERLDRLEEAIAHYRQTLQINPNHTRARKKLQQALAGKADSPD